MGAISATLPQNDDAVRKLRAAHVVCFDVDSTVLTVEGIDELADLAGVSDEVKKLTSGTCLPARIQPLTAADDQSGACAARNHQSQYQSQYAFCWQNLLCGAECMCVLRRMVVLCSGYGRCYDIPNITTSTTRHHQTQQRSHLKSFDPPTTDTVPFAQRAAAHFFAPLSPKDCLLD